MKDNIKKIIYIVTAFVITGVALFNSFSVPVLASTEVESLPRTDIDVNVTFDSENIYMNYNNSVYQFPFSVSLKVDGKYLAYYTDTSEPYYYAITSSVTSHTNKNGNYVIPFSYWFSPTEHRVYVLSGFNTSNYSEPVGKVVSYYNGTFVFDLANAYLYLSYYDLNDMSFNPLGVVSLDGTDDKRGGVYPKMRIGTNGLFSKYCNETGSSVNFPSDLLCVYSNMDISGFYELDNQSVYTPDYYFEYQYLFYVEGVGYTFVDSAENLVDVVNRSDGYAYLDFLDIGNRRVWTSIDGVSWSYSNKVQNMYGDEIQIEYQWLYDSVGSDASFIAKLVYTTDLEYGQEPLVKPEYGDINDVVADLNNIIINGGPFPSGRGDGYTFEELESMTELDYYKFIMYGFTHQYYKRITIVYGDGSTDCVYDIESGRYGSVNRGDKTFSYCTIEYVPTLAMYLYDLNLTLDDTNKLLESVKITLHDDLKSVFDNISLSNFYLESIDSALGSLPDYTKKLDKILLAIENLEITGSGGVVDLSSLEQYLIMIDDTSEIQILLEELDKSIDNIAKIEVFDEITDSSDIAGDVVDNVFDEVFDFEKAPELSKGADEVSGMISGAIGQLATGSILIGAFDYASNITSGVGFINANVNNFYEASSVMKPVFLSGAAMFVVNLVLRRKE